MARTLVTINGIASRNLANLTFMFAWKRFLDAHADQLDADFLFVSNGFPRDIIEEVAAPFPVFHIGDHCHESIGVPFDTESTYWPIRQMVDTGKWDYVLRVDHDAFPSVESLQTLISSPRTEEADFVSACNFPRPIEHERDVIQALDNRFVPLEERVAFKWLPWRYPTHNSDLFVIRSEFFKMVDSMYHQHDIILSRKPGLQCPFHTTGLTYGEVCDELGYEDERGCRDLRISIDGSINSDWWTLMCRSKPKYLGVVNRWGESFADANHITRHGAAMAHNSFEEVRDNPNTAFPHDNTLVAPYFHLGNGYLCEWYLNPRHSAVRESFEYFAGHFRTAPFGAYAVQWVIFRMLAENCPVPQLRDEMPARVLYDVMRPVGTNMEDWNKFEQEVRAFYGPALEGYR